MKINSLRNKSEKLLFGYLIGFITISIVGGVILAMIQFYGSKDSNSADLNQNSLSDQVYSLESNHSSSFFSIEYSDEVSESNHSDVVSYSETDSSFPSSISESSRQISSQISSIESSLSEPQKNELVADKAFLRGFGVKGLSTIIDGNKNIGFFDYDGDQNVQSTNPIWTLAPWYSKYSIGLDHNFTRINDNYFRYEDASKRVEIDTKNAMISLRIDASKEYTEPRQQGEAWPHLLIGQPGKGYSDSPYFDVRKIHDMDEFRVTLDTRLTYFNDAMGEDANPNLHGSGFYIYLYVQNLNKADSASYGQMIWFGFPLFDNRTAWCPEYGAADSGKEDASGMFIYQVPQNQFMPVSFWKDGAPYGNVNNEWIHIDFDCKPYVERALQLAHERNFLKNTTMNDLYFNGFNIGWEMYGTYDGEIQVRNFQVVSIFRD